MRLNEIENQYITMYHGGRNLESDYNEILGNKSGQIAHGVGLYLISDVSIAAKYAKGGNKLYRVTIEKGNNAEDVMIPAQDCLDYAKKIWGTNKAKQKEFLEYFRGMLKRINSEEISAESFSNLMLNFEFIKPAKTGAFRQFLIDHGVDYSVSRNFGGSKNTMIVLVNPKKIKKVEIIKWSDLSSDEYNLDSPQDGL